MPKFDMPKMDMPKVDMPKMDIPKVAMPQFEAPKFAAPSGDYDSTFASEIEDIEPQEIRDERAKGARSIYKEADQTAQVSILCDKS
jgi:hypothetical protein